MDKILGSAEITDMYFVPKGTKCRIYKGVASRDKPNKEHTTTKDMYFKNVFLTQDHILALVFKKDEWRIIVDECNITILELNE